jgi:hypothetical protein
MLEKMIVSGVAGLIAYNTQPNIKKYLEGKDSPLKELLPGRVSSAVITGSLVYLGTKAYERSSSRMGNPFINSGYSQRPSTSLIDLSQLALGAYTHAKMAGNTKKLDEIGHAIANLGNAMIEKANEKALPEES